MINSHANLFQNIGKCASKTDQGLTNISKFTGNRSKNTSKFTSKTNQIRFSGGHGGGLPPSEASPRLYSPPKRGAWFLDSKQTGLELKLSGGIHSREGSQVAIHLFPGASSQMAPQMLGDR